MAGKRGLSMQVPAIVFAGIGASLGSVFLFGKLADEILEHRVACYRHTAGGRGA